MAPSRGAGAGWENTPAKRNQKGVDARWTKKHGKGHDGYKNHVNVDRKHMQIRRYHVTVAAEHDSQAVDALLMRGNTAFGVRANAAYRSVEIEATLRARGLTSRIHRKGNLGKPVLNRAKQGNRARSLVRVRAKAEIGMKNIAFNIRRLGLLRRLNPFPA